jgi:hypothetical protein
VGAPRYYTLAGQAKVFSGAAGTVLRAFEGNELGDNFGAAVAGAGDLDGDGHADVLVGAPRPRDERRLLKSPGGGAGPREGSFSSRVPPSGAPPRRTLGSSPGRAFLPTERGS